MTEPNPSTDSPLSAREEADRQEALIAAIEGQNLWHTRHATSPAGAATALAILSSLRHSGWTVARAAHPESRPDPGEGLIRDLEAMPVMLNVGDDGEPLVSRELMLETVRGALASPVPTDRRVEPLAAILLECHEQDGMDSKAEAEAVVAWLDLHAPACVCGWLEVPTDRPEPIDEERLWKAIAGRHAADDRVGDLLNDLPEVLAAYRTEPGETK